MHYKEQHVLNWYNRDTFTFLFTIFFLQAGGILNLFLSLADTPILADYLASHHLFSVLTHSSFVSFVRDRLYPYLEDGERNIWHHVWCLLLSVIITMSHSLSTSTVYTNFVESVLEFITSHHHRIKRCIDLTIHHELLKESEVPTREGEDEDMTQSTFPISTLFFLIVFF